MRISRESRLYVRLRKARNQLIIWQKRLSAAKPTSYVHPSATVARDLVADDYVFIGPRCTISPVVEIGRYTMLAAGVSIVGDDHRFDQVGVPMQFTGRPRQRPTVIGSDVWIGHGAVILRGITIGDGAIVAAGAVVTKDVAPYEVWGGVPARYLRDRFESSDRAQHAAMLAGPLVAPRFVQPLDWDGLDPAGRVAGSPLHR